MMTDLDVVYLAVASADHPISATEICSIAELERDEVNKALRNLSNAGRITRTMAPNPLAGRNGQKGAVFVYTPAPDIAPPKAKQEADGWTDAIRAAALRPASRWIVTPMDAVTFDNREAAVDKATQLATSEGIDFAIVRVEAVASVKVEIEWDK